MIGDEILFLLTAEQDISLTFLVWVAALGGLNYSQVHYFKSDLRLYEER